MFTDHKIAAFDQPIAALPDTPQLAPAALKAYFDASPEQLRRAVDGICDEAAALDTKVEGIVAETYGGTIHETMLDAPLGTKLNAKADQTALDAETAALQAQITAIDAAKCEIVFGTYHGDGKAEKFIELGFTPKALLAFTSYGATTFNTGANTYPGGFALKDLPSYSGSNTQPNIKIVENGFTVYYTQNSPYARANEGLHYYMAFK